MCGIIGCIGNRAIGVVLDGLKTLDYRGYDSYGIAYPDKTLHVHKRVGKITNELDALRANPATSAIGHTRWATHGGVTETNAHPHLSFDGKIAVVHNGIIDNADKLRDRLTSLGIECVSQTDTEVIPHLVALEMTRYGSFIEAIRSVIRLLEGSYSFLAITPEGDIGFARNGAPLVLGISEDATYIASDIPAFLDHTRTVVHLEDGESGIVRRDGTLTIWDAHGRALQKATRTVTWNAEEARKGDYPHYMLKEIAEQQDVLRRIANADVTHAIALIRNAKGIFFVACGTSYHACVSAQYLFSHIAKAHVNVTIASEFSHYEEFIVPETLVVAVSQSGETADVIEAVKTAKRKGAQVLAIINAQGTTLATLADHTLPMNAGPEICVCSTKAYTAEIGLIILLATGLAGHLDDGRRAIRDIDITLPDVKILAQRLRSSEAIFLIGRDLALPAALEGALKIKEASYLRAEGFPGGELKHGTIALLTHGTPVIVLATDKTRNAILSNAQECKARGAFIIGIDHKKEPVYDTHIPIAQDGLTDPITLVVPLQLLAYQLSVLRGCDPDKPRNLAKSVTVR